MMTQIAVTHVGSLPRNQKVVDFIFARERNKTYDLVTFDAAMAEAVDTTVRKQVEAGVNIVSDGETSKISYATYVKDRYTGFSGDSPRNPPADLKMFPSFLQRLANDGGTPTYARPMCTGEVKPERPKRIAERHRQPQSGHEETRCRARLHERRITRCHFTISAKCPLRHARELSRRPRRCHA